MVILKENLNHWFIPASNKGQHPEKILYQTSVIVKWGIKKITSQKIEVNLVKQNL